MSVQISRKYNDNEYFYTMSALQPYGLAMEGVEYQMTVLFICGLEISIISTGKQQEQSILN